MKTDRKMQLRCPAGNLKAVDAALENGADAVYIGFESPTNLRHFKGLNLSLEDSEAAVKRAHAAGKSLYVVINSYPQKGEVDPACRAIDQAVDLGIDAVIVSDISNMEYAHKTHPELPLHVSVQAGSANAETVNFFAENFGVSCVVLPRVLTVDEISTIIQNASVDIEVFGLGSLCTSYPGRCNLSQYLTGESTNTQGVCTSPKFMDFRAEGDDSVLVRLSGIALNKVECKGSINSCSGRQGSDVLKLRGEDGWTNSFIVNKRHVCKGTFINEAFDGKDFSMHDWVILNTLPMLGKLIEIGVNALKVEGRQRPSLYSAEAARIVREAIDLYYVSPENYKPKPEWNEAITQMFPEMTCSTGPYLGR
jgi:putative protease